jgi:uncharacterized OB-fold protein
MIDRPDLSALAPATDPDSAWFWEALGEGKLMLPECKGCERCFFPPMAFCPYCAGTEIGRVQGSGGAKAYSWVKIHIALDPTFAADAPYTIVAADLAEGGRMMGRLLDADADQLSDGTPLVFSAYRVGDIVLPGFRLKAEESG